MPIRLGRISFINVAPVYYALEKNIIAHTFELVRDIPAHLNDMMKEGALQISSCSCLEYARRFQQYFLLNDLSIASPGPVMSVLLLSRKPVEELDGSEMLVSGQSHTSVVLTRLLLQERYDLEVRMRTGNVEESLERGVFPDAVLTIGDEALRLRKHPRYPFVTDLALAWREWTHLPFVFAVWVMSRKAAPQFSTDPALLIQKSRDYGLAHLDEVIPTVLGKTPLSKEELHFYYKSALRYTLSSDELKGLSLFYKKIAHAKLIDECPEIVFFTAN